MNQAEYLGELHQAMAAYKEAVREAGDALDKRQQAAHAAFLGNSQPDGHQPERRRKEAVR